MAQHFALTRIQRALRHNPPSATDRDYQPGDNVLVCVERTVENRIAEWLGPYTVVSYDAQVK